MIFSLLQLFGGILLSLCWIPQIRQILRTKSVKNLNLTTFLLVLLGEICMETYATKLLLLGEWEFFATNTIAMMVELYIVILILYYRRK
jgi:MtN3 and saliva related transmembrane protein